MNVGLLELNDAGLRYYRNGELLSQSPGYALVEPDRLTFGDAAKAQAKLQPLKIQHQYWQQLNLEPLQLANKRVRHRADLAYYQLRELLPENLEETPQLLAIPGSFSAQQLAILLGILQPLALPLAGLVDNALLAALHQNRPGRYVHLDIQLHQVVISELVLDDHWQRRHVEVLGATGLLHLQDQWAQGITDQFIQQTRFNPLHRAASEQALHDQQLAWLKQAIHSDGSLRISLDERDITLLAGPVLARAERVYQRIGERLQQRFAGVQQVLLSDRLAALPGAQDFFRHDYALHTTPEAQWLQNVEAALSQLSGEQSGHTFITQLAPVAPPTGGQAQADNPTPAVTHLLRQHQAYRLDKPVYLSATGQVQGTPGDDTIASLSRDQQQLYLSLSNGQVAQVNGREVHGNTPLQAGDKLHIGSWPASCLLISETELNPGDHG